MAIWDDFEKSYTQCESKKLSTEMIDFLINHGVDKGAASSAAAKKVVDALMEEDDKIIMREAEAQVKAMKKIVEDSRAEYKQIRESIEDIDRFTKDIRNAQTEYGGLTDEKARNAVVMYSALMKMNSSAYDDGRSIAHSTDPGVIIKGASYCVYAFLGGQARRIYFDGDDFKP